MPANSRPPRWSTVWLEARAAGRDPVDALVAAGIIDAAAVGPSSAAELPRLERPRPAPRGPRADPPAGLHTVAAAAGELVRALDQAVRPVRAAG